MTELYTPTMLIEQPWVVYDRPTFYDEWEAFTNTLPKNMSLVHHIGLRSYWETFILSANGQRMNLHSHNFAPFGVQFGEDEYAEAFAVAKGLAARQKILHIRNDLEGAVEETWRNTSFRHIEGHSFHKIHPQTLSADYIEIDGKLWHIRDYFENQIDTV